MYVNYLYLSERKRRKRICLEKILKQKNDHKIRWCSLADFYTTNFASLAKIIIREFSA